MCFAHGHSWDLAGLGCGFYAVVYFPALFRSVIQDKSSPIRSTPTVLSLATFQLHLIFS